MFDLLINVETLILKAHTTQAAFSPNGAYFLTSNPKGETVFWSTKQGKPFLRLKELCTISPDGKLGLTSSGKILTLPQGKQVLKLPDVKASLISPDGRYAVGRGDLNKAGNVVKMWQIAFGSE